MLIIGEHIHHHNAHRPLALPAPVPARKVPHPVRSLTVSPDRIAVLGNVLQRL
jgi:hypothetical protein